MICIRGLTGAARAVDALPLVVVGIRLRGLTGAARAVEALPLVVEWACGVEWAVGREREARARFLSGFAGVIGTWF